MSRSKKLFIWFFFFQIIPAQHILGQNNLSVRLISLTVHPTNKQSTALYNYMLDEKGVYTFEPGIIMSYESFGDDLTSIVISQAAFKDAALHWAGYTQLMVRRKLGQIYKHYFYAGIGPIVHYRQSWSDMILYRDEPFYELSEDNSFQYRIGWISGELEYKYYLAKKIDVSIVINHIKPESVTATVGIKYWFSRKASKRCRTCPSFKK